MAGDGYEFDVDGVRRIVRAVRKVEGMPSQRIDRDPSLPHAEFPPVIFRNDSASGSDTVPAYGVMALIGTTIIGDDPIKLIEKPSTNFRRTYMVNGPTPVAQNEFGLGYMPLGQVVEALYATAPTSNLEGYGPKAGTWTLEKYYPNTCESFGIIRSTNIAGSSDTPTMSCTLHPINEIIGKIASTLGPHATCDVAIYAGSSEVALSMTLHGVKDWLMVSTDTSPSTGTNCIVSWKNGLPYMTEIACGT